MATAWRPSDRARCEHVFIRSIDDPEQMRCLRCGADEPRPRLFGIDDINRAYQRGYRDGHAWGHMEYALLPDESDCADHLCPIPHVSPDRSVQWDG